jgi:hypothetical protein
MGHEIAKGLCPLRTETIKRRDFLESYVAFTLNLLETETRHTAAFGGHGGTEICWSLGPGNEAKEGCAASPTTDTSIFTTGYSSISTILFKQNSSQEQSLESFRS